jgi:hypothetical protein
MHKSGFDATFETHLTTLDFPSFAPTMLFNFVRIYGYIPSPRTSCQQPTIDNMYKKLDDPWSRYPESHQDLVDSACFPLLPLPSRITLPSAYHLCPSCGHSPLSANTTLTTSYYTPRVSLTRHSTSPSSPPWTSPHGTPLMHCPFPHCSPFCCTCPCSLSTLGPCHPRRKR